MTQISAIRLVLTGSGGTITGSWYSVTDPYPVISADLSVASIGRDPATGKLTWDVTGSASNFWLLDGPCKQSNQACTMTMKTKHVNFSVTALATVSGIYGEPYPYSHQFVGMASTTQITDVRTKVSSASGSYVSSSVPFTYPYPGPTTSLSIASVGRDPVTGKFTYDVTGSASNYALPDAFFNPGHACSMYVEAKQSNGTIVGFDQSVDLSGALYPYTHHFVGSSLRSEVLELRSKVSNQYGSVVGPWIAIDDPYPTPSVVITDLLVGRDPVNGRFLTI